MRRRRILSPKPRKISFFALRLLPQFARDCAGHRKKPRFSRFFGGFRRGAVTLHQELNGITRSAAGEHQAKKPGIHERFVEFNTTTTFEERN
jgi:hypothetical protein